MRWGVRPAYSIQDLCSTLDHALAVDWTIGPYNGKAVFSGLYLISFLPADIQFASPTGQRVDILMVVPVLTQIL